MMKCKVTTQSLKPCPGCGKEGRIYKNEGDYDTSYEVGCSDFDCGWGAGYADTDEQAIEKWNNRISREAASLIDTLRVMTILRQRQAEELSKYSTRVKKLLKVQLAAAEFAYDSYRKETQVNARVVPGDPVLLKALLEILSESNLQEKE